MNSCGFQTLMIWEYGSPTQAVARLKFGASGRHGAGVKKSLIDGSWQSSRVKSARTGRASVSNAMRASRRHPDFLASQLDVREPCRAVVGVKPNAARDGPKGKEVTDYRLLSVIINDRELLSSPALGYARIPIGGIFANDDDTGRAVGGPTCPASLAAVPLSPAAAAAIAIALLGSGFVLSSRGTGQAGSATQIR